MNTPHLLPEQLTHARQPMGYFSRVVAIYDEQNRWLQPTDTLRYGERSKSDLPLTAYQVRVAWQGVAGEVQHPRLSEYAAYNKAAAINELFGQLRQITRKTLFVVAQQEGNGNVFKAAELLGAIAVPFATQEIKLDVSGPQFTVKPLVRGIDFEEGLLPTDYKVISGNPFYDQFTLKPDSTLLQGNSRLGSYQWFDAQGSAASTRIK